MTPQYAAWQSAYKYNARDLDSGFAKLQDEIQSRCTIIDKYLKVKVAAWMKRLSEEVGDPTA